MKRLIIIVFALFLAINYSCKESFMDTVPLGVASENAFYNQKGVDAILIGAYSLLDGVGSGNEWASAVSNWVWGSVCSDDAYKGSDAGDQSPINDLERYQPLTTNSYVAGRWRTYYDGVSRCNDALKMMAKAQGLTDEYQKSIRAQALFLRAWYHFELKRTYNNIPYITEDVPDPAKVPNTVDAWPLIESDLTFAYQNLPETQAQVGRATKWAAAAVLARVYLFQNKWDQAQTLLDAIINSNKYSLMDNFHDNFKIATQNNKESIFEIQMSVNDGSNGSYNANWGDMLNFPYAPEVGLCCGFHQPSQNFVNAFKVDANGLPLLDTFNDVDLKWDNLASADQFVPFEDYVDPRLDWVVGRRGIPYLDWFVHRGKDWVRDQDNGGPYTYKRMQFYKSEKGTLSSTSGWGLGQNANNIRAYRYSHVLLWRAEVAAEKNDLAKATELVNMIRKRAGDDPKDFVMGKVTRYSFPTTTSGVYSDLEAAGQIDWTKPAANYKVGLYPTFPNQEYARKAIRHEMRLEYGMEGHRFFDLVRWGIAAETLNKYLEKERTLRTHLSNTSFRKGINEYWPIPQAQRDIQNADGEVLKQNNGF